VVHVLDQVVNHRIAKAAVFPVPVLRSPHVLSLEGEGLVLSGSAGTLIALRP
jgi:hypothetical protein